MASLLSNYISAESGSSINWRSQELYIMECLQSTYKYIPRNHENTSYKYQTLNFWGFQLTRISYNSLFSALTTGLTSTTRSTTARSSSCPSSSSLQPTQGSTFSSPGIIWSNAKGSVDCLAIRKIAEWTSVGPIDFYAFKSDTFGFPSYCWSQIWSVIQGQGPRGWVGEKPTTWKW